jgi:hypothetical protein
MPVFPSQNLNSQKICESYNKLLQYYDSGIVLDGTGSQVQFLNVTASYALNCNCPPNVQGHSVTGSFCSSSIWTFNHNLGEKYVIIQAYDNNDNQLIPEVINLYDENTAIIAFSQDTCGTAIATYGITNGNDLVTGSTYPITSSWALSASWAPCTCPLLQTGSTYPITASWAIYAINGGTTLVTGSTYPITSSWALTASYTYFSNYGNSVTQSFCSSSIWTFNHNLGDKYVLIQAYDQYDNQIIADVVNLFDDNTAILSFGEDVCGTAVATRGGLRYIYSIQSGSGGTNLVTGSTYPITSSWALSASWAPCTCDLTGDTVAQQFFSSSTWVFTHNLDDLPVLVQAYDYGNNQIVPSNIKLNNNNVVTLTFPVSESGWAIASRSGLKIRSGSLLQTGSTYPITSSWALYTATSSYIQVSGVTYPVRKIYNNYTVVRTADYTILCDATSGSFNVVLPNPVGNTNIYNIKKIDKTGHDVHVTVANASHIDFDVTQSISHRGTNMMVQSDGTNQYWIL